MATQEFYIRSATETEARGPFNYEQLTTLAENGQIDAATLYYEAGTEQWVALGSNPELVAALFPEKRKLKMGKKEISSLNQQEDNAPPISVDDMLAAAEGLTEDTKGRRDPAIVQGLCARIGLYTATLLLAINAIALCLPSADLLQHTDKFDISLILQKPLVILGVVDALLTLMLGLQVMTIYPIVRFRAMLGLGLFGFIFWCQGRTLPLVAVAAGSIGLYLCTIVLSYTGVALATVLGLVGTGAFAYFTLS